MERKEGNDMKENKNDDDDDDDDDQVHPSSMPVRSTDGAVPLRKEDEAPSKKEHGGLQLPSEDHPDVNGTMAPSNDPKGTFVSPHATRTNGAASDSKPSAKLKKSDERSMVAVSDQSCLKVGAVAVVGGISQHAKEQDDSLLGAESVAPDTNVGTGSVPCGTSSDKEVTPIARAVTIGNVSNVLSMAASSSEKPESKGRAVSVTGGTASTSTIDGVAMAKRDSRATEDEKSRNPSIFSGAHGNAESNIQSTTASKVGPTNRRRTKGSGTNSVSVWSTTSVAAGVPTTGRDCRKDSKDNTDNSDVGGNDDDDDDDSYSSRQVGAIPIVGIGTRTATTQHVNFGNGATVHHRSVVPGASSFTNPEGLATAFPVNEDEVTMYDQPDPFGVYYTAEVVDEQEILGWNGFWRRNKWAISILVVLMVTGVILGTIFGIRASGTDEVIDAQEAVLRAGSRRFQQAAKILLGQGVSDRNVLLDPGLTAPQYRALTWLADEDEAEIDLSNESLVIQRYSLAAIFFSTGGATWTDTFNFTSILNECQWYSVRSGVRYGVAECSDDGVVKALQMNENNLNGTIPDELGWLPFLTSADFSNNGNMEGSIPTTIGLLTNLETFAITNSTVAGALPAEIGGATSLVAIRAGGNRLSGAIPTEIGELTLLKTLSLERNVLSGSLPDTIGRLSSIQVLLLKVNTLTGTIPNTFSALRNLREVDLSFNLFVDGAENICTMNITNLSIYKTDCLSQLLPSIPQELPCSCCTDCCSEDFAGCRPSYLNG